MQRAAGAFMIPLTEVMNWTLRELTNYQIGYNQRLENELDIVRVQTYKIAGYSGNMKPGTTLERFWSTESAERRLEKLKERLSVMDNDPRFPDKLPVKK